MSEKIFKRKDLWLYLHSEALLHNVKILKSCCRNNVKFCAVIKANAYGHGISEVVAILKNAEVVQRQEFFLSTSVIIPFHP